MSTATNTRTRLAATPQTPTSPCTRQPPSAGRGPPPPAPCGRRSARPGPGRASPTPGARRRRPGGGRCAPRARVRPRPGTRWARRAAAPAGPAARARARHIRWASPPDRSSAAGRGTPPPGRPAPAPPHRRLAGRGVGHPQVVPHRPGEGDRPLEDHAHLAPQGERVDGRDVAAAEPDHAGLRCLQPVEAAQERRLPRARGPQEDRDRPPRTRRGPRRAAPGGPRAPGTPPPSPAPAGSRAEPRACGTAGARRR